MRFDTLNRYNVTAEMWELIARDEYGTTTYGNQSVINCSVVFDGVRSLMFTDQFVKQGSQLRNFMDANGILITEDYYEIRKKFPVVNNFGLHEGDGYVLGLSQFQRMDEDDALIEQRTQERLDRLKGSETYQRLLKEYQEYTLWLESELAAGRDGSIEPGT